MLCLCQRWFARTRGDHFTETERHIFTASRRTTRMRDACKAVQNTELMCRRICQQPRHESVFAEQMHRQLAEHAPTRPVESPDHSPFQAHSRSAQQPTSYKPIKRENEIGARSQLEHCGRKSAHEGLAGCRGQVVSSVRIRRRRGCDMNE